jgi:hypothetical protein
MLGKARALKRYSRRQMGRMGGVGGGGGGGGDWWILWLIAIIIYFYICNEIVKYISCKDMSRNCEPDFFPVFLVAILLAFFLFFCFWAIDFIVTRIKDK